MQQHLQEVIDQHKFFILDGFPRSERSLYFLIDFLHKNNILQKVYFLQFQASDQLCKQRMLGRYVCNACGRVDNIMMLGACASFKCMFCGEVLAKRSGDIEEVIDKRLHYFHATIEPLLKQIEVAGYITKIIDTTLPLDELEKLYEKLF